MLYASTSGARNCAMITVAQLRAARGLVKWSQDRLADASGVAISTIRRMEASEGLLRGNAENVWKIQRALEDAEVVFIDENGGGPGVRLRNPTKR